jgi:hypothetical protein
MQKIADLNLPYGQITWDQVYLVMVIWALELMGGKYQFVLQYPNPKISTREREHTTYPLHLTTVRTYTLKVPLWYYSKES